MKIRRMHPRRVYVLREAIPHNSEGARTGATWEYPAT